MPFLQLTTIPNAITLVRLLVPINGHSIDGQVDRGVVVICSDPLRHESRRLTDLHQEPCPSVNGRRTLLHTMLVDHMEENCSIRSQGQVRVTAAMRGSLSGYAEGAWQGWRWLDELRRD